MRKVLLSLFGAVLVGAAAFSSEPAQTPPAVPAAAPAVANGDFEAARPWDGWELTPAEPREAGRSEWERLAAEFTVPAAGRVTVELADRKSVV